MGNNSRRTEIVVLLGIVLLVALVRFGVHVVHSYRAPEPVRPPVVETACDSVEAVIEQRAAERQTADSLRKANKKKGAKKGPLQRWHLDEPVPTEINQGKP